MPIKRAQVAWAGAAMIQKRRRSSYDREEAASPGLPDRTAGLLWIAGGAAVTFFTYAIAAPGGVYVVAWGAMLYGVVQVLGTIGDAHDSDGVPLSYQERIVLGQEMALRAMFFIAKEAGGITGTRSTTIDTVLWRITDVAFPPERRSALLAEVEVDGDRFLDMVRVERDKIAPSFVDIILQSAAQVALASGAIAPNVEAKLRALAKALRLDDAAVEAALSTAQPN